MCVFQNEIAMLMFECAVLGGLDSVIIHPANFHTHNKGGSVVILVEEYTKERLIYALNWHCLQTPYIMAIHIG